MPATLSVPIGVERTTQFNARKLSDGLLKTGSETIKAKYVKQSSPLEYWNGSAWVTADPSNQAMAQDATFAGTYEDAVTYDEAGVDYIVKCWDSVDADVQELVLRIKGVQPTEADGVWRVHVTVKETDQNGDVVPDVTVSLRNSGGDEMDRDSTNSSGVASLGIAGAGTYTVVLVKATWSFDDETLVISASDDTPKTAEYYGTEFDPGSPATGLCRVYGWLRQLEEAAAVQDQRIKADLYDDDVPAVGDGVYYDSDKSQDTPDSEGYWYLDLIRSTLMADARVRVYSVDLQSTLPSGAIDKLIRVPDQASAELASIEVAEG